IRRGYQVGRYRDATACIIEDDAWYPTELLFAHAPPASVPSIALSPGAAFGPDRLDLRCPTCLETVPLGGDAEGKCPECGESTVIAAGPTTQRPGSIPDDPPGATWFAMHWRPLVTIGAMATLVCTGIALRYLAPNRFASPR